MNLKNVLLCIFLLFGMHVTACAQSCPANIDFETGTTANWNYYRGQNNPGPVWSLASCPPDRYLHRIAASYIGTDYYGGYSIVGDGLYSLWLGKDTADNNADAATYNIHVPVGAPYKLMYRYAVDLADTGEALADKARFEINVVDSATGAPLPCFPITVVSSMPGFLHSPYATSDGADVWYRPWTAGNVDLSSMGGKTVTVSFKVGGSTNGAHMGYAYVDMNCGVYKVQTVGCMGGTIPLTGPAGDSLYHWTDSLTYTSSYGSTQTISMAVPTVTTTYAAIVTPFAGYGCKDTLYTRLVPSNMVTHPARDTAICLGSSVRIWGGATDILPLTYSWTPATGLSCSSCDTALATPPLGLNSYKITTRSTYGCSLVDTVNVHVYPIPAALTGLLSICAGAATALSDATAGGAWSSGNTAVAAIGSSGIVTGIAPGTATITYTFGTACATVYTTVTVNPMALPILGTAVLCNGSGTALSDATTGGTWSSGTTTVAGIGSSTGIVMGLSPGTAMITYTVAGMCHAFTTMTVNLSPVAITGITSACSGAVTQLTDAVGGGKWTSGTTSVAAVGSLTGIVSGAGAGTSMITYAIGSCAVSVTVTIVLPPGPITGAVPVAAGETITLSDAVTGGTWSSGNTAVATVGAVTGLVAGVAAGTAIITNTSGGMCRAYMVVTVKPSRLNANDLQANAVGSINIFPNPASGQLNIQWANQKPGNADVMITDMLGSKLCESVIGLNSGEGETQIKLEGLNDGIYLVTIRSATMHYAARLVIMH